MLDKIKSLLMPQRKMCIDSDALPGEGISIQRLPVTSVKYIFTPVQDLLSPRYVQLFSDELAVEVDVVLRTLKMLVEHARNDVSCCIEYPYVEEYYRNSFYQFYSRRHTEFCRYCFRISFFEGSVVQKGFFSCDLSGKFYGYVTLRPTPKRIIGYSYLSPVLFPDFSASCCLCERESSIMGRRLSCLGFPYIGNDDVVLSCAESAIIVLADYYSRRHRQYANILPTEIFNELSQLAESPYPSKGLDADTISSILHTRGFNTIIIKRNEGNSGDDLAVLRKNIQTYIDSGIPVIASTDNHTYVIIGRANEMWSDDTEVIVADGNCRPYHSKKIDENLESVIIPLPEKVYSQYPVSNTYRVFRSFTEEYPDMLFFLPNHAYISRGFITPSRSFKEYIVTQPLSDDLKNLIVCTNMPHFIWVCELIDRNDVSTDFYATTLSGVVVIDATESENNLRGVIMAKSQTHLLVPKSTSLYGKREFRVFKTEQARMTIYNKNLKH